MRFALTFEKRIVRRFWTWKTFQHVQTNLPSLSAPATNHHNSHGDGHLLTGGRYHNKVLNLWFTLLHFLTHGTRISLSRVIWDFPVSARYLRIGLESCLRMSTIVLLAHSCYSLLNFNEPPCYLSCKVHSEYEIDSLWCAWNVLLNCQSWKLHAQDKINRINL